ncbi:MAG: DNA gyrase subunit A [Chloroflexota bacterium]
MEIGIVKPIAIEDEMRSSYLDYAMSVIVSRALPDVRDGLKPVHRRILVTLHDLSLTHTAHYRKSAKICGDVSGNYHPHGEAVVYPSMARLAQDFNMRYPLVDGQGNFGSIDGDSPAAMRYTEARMTAITEEMLADIDKNTVNWTDNYDSTRKEPVVLPSRLPNLLLNGSAGIAVGMATNIPPHNLRELCDAISHMIGRYGAAVEAGVPFDIMWERAHGRELAEAILEQALQKPGAALRARVQEKAAQLGLGPRKGATPETLLAVVDDLVEMPPEELLAIVKGPDFPTAGLILGLDGIKSAYTTGRGRVVLRAKAHAEEMRGGRWQVVVTELPYQVNKATLLEKIAELVRDKRIDGISDLRDESDREGMRIVIELKRDAMPRRVLKLLYKHTAMQLGFSVNMLALVDGQPRTLTLKAALRHFIDHRQEVVTRRTQFDLDKARQRAHILEGLKIALDHLDEVIAIIRRSRDAERARNTLIEKFALSELQAQAILEMQLRRLAALERQKILDELAEVRKVVAHYEDLLAHPLKILYLVRDEMEELKAKYGDERRTVILPDEPTEISDEDLIPDQEVVVGLTQRGYVRRLPVEIYRPQRRARGAGTGAIVTREDDVVLQLMVANTKSSVLLFTDRGRVFQMRVNDIPDATRQSRGLPLANFISIDGKESVTALVPLHKANDSQFLVMLTRKGEVKRIALDEFANIRSSGLIAMGLEEGDELGWVRATKGNEELFVHTEKGQCIRFSETEVRSSGRGSGGIRAVRLSAGDHAAGLDYASRGKDLVTVTERGTVKRSSVAEYPLQGRGGAGVRGATVTAHSGPVVAARVANVGDEIMIATAEGVVFRSAVNALRRKGRGTLGVGLLRVAPGDRVVALAVLFANGDSKPTPDGTKGKVATASPDGKKSAAKAPAKQGVLVGAAVGGDGDMAIPSAEAENFAPSEVEALSEAISVGQAALPLDAAPARKAGPSRARAAAPAPAAAPAKAAKAPATAEKAPAKPAAKAAAAPAKAEKAPAKAEKAPAAKAEKPAPTSRRKRE